MATLINNKLKNLNKYSWSILVSFVCVIFSMLYRTAHASFAGFFQTLPLIITAVYCCERHGPLINQPEQYLKKSELFTRDLFILSFSFLLACLLSSILSYNNSDVKGWWPLISYFITLYGLFFSVLFALVALAIKNHKTYIKFFSFLIILFVSMGKFIPTYIFIPSLGSIDTFYVITSLLLIFHCLFAIIYKIIELI